MLLAKSDYAARLIKEYGCTAAELQQAATTALSELLYDYTNFNVSTIDSFSRACCALFLARLTSKATTVLLSMHPTQSHRAYR